MQKGRPSLTFYHQGGLFAIQFTSYPQRMASSVFRDFALKGTLAKHSMIEGRELSSFVTEEKQNIFHKQFYPEELFFS